MTHVAQGIYRPPEADLDVDGVVCTVTPWRVQVHELRKDAGPCPGLCVISYPCYYARDDSPQMGKRATLRVGGVKLFRGVVGDVPYEIDDRTDMTWLRLYDDRWPLSRGVVGQGGVGTQGTPAGARGFQHVGFDLVLNAQGIPNKDPSSLDFNTGSGASSWTCKTAMQFLFNYYVDSDIARLTVSTLSANWDRVPVNLNLTGLTIVQAIDRLAQAAGESWTLVPNAAGEYSDFRPVRPGYGTVRRCKLFTPRRGATADSVTDEHPVRVMGGKSIRNCRDVVQVVSGNCVKESTYVNYGSNPLLKVQPAFVDDEYAVRLCVDVTKYATNDIASLGGNLAAGSPPKPWLSTLITRRDSTDYLAAGESGYNAYPRVPEPVLWINTNTATDPWLRVADGYRIDCHRCTLDIRNTIKVYIPPGGGIANQAQTTQTLRVTPDSTNFGVAFTVVTQLEFPQFVQSADGNKYLPKSYFHVIRRPDLVPELRQKALLPALTGDPNARITVATPDEETYLSRTTQLEAIRDAAFAAMNQIECPLEAQYAFIPEMEIGDRLLVQGRKLGATGNEVIVSISYMFRNGIPDFMSVRATNIVAAIDPDDAGVEAVNP